MSSSSKSLLAFTADIVSAYCARNAMQTEALTGLIQQIHQALAVASSGEESQGTVTVQAPAVPVKRSVFPDHIICLEDGKKLKMLKRHLQSAYGMTPEAYRAKWGLPPSYPMVAPAYAEKRSVLARQIGLGRKPGHAQPVEDMAETAETAVETVDEPKVRKLPERKRGSVRRKG